MIGSCGREEEPGSQLREKTRGLVCGNCIHHPTYSPFTAMHEKMMSEVNHALLQPALFTTTKARNAYNPEVEQIIAAWIGNQASLKGAGRRLTAEEK